MNVLHVVNMLNIFYKLLKIITKKEIYTYIFFNIKLCISRWIMLIPVTSPEKEDPLTF